MIPFPPSFPTDTSETLGFRLLFAIKPTRLEWRTGETVSADLITRVPAFGRSLHNRPDLARPRAGASRVNVDSFLVRKTAAYLLGRSQFGNCVSYFGMAQFG